MSLEFIYNNIDIATNAKIELPIRDIQNTGLSIIWGDGVTDNNVTDHNPYHIYTQNIRDLTELTNRNTILIQENLDLKSELKIILNEVKNLQGKMETTININLLQNDEILILKEMISNYQKT
jgi:hypothetical protein